MKKVEEKMKQKEITPTKAIVAMIPLIASFALLVHLKMRQAGISAGEGGEMLAPPIETSSMVTAVVIFMLGYLLFMTVMFYENIREGVTHLIEKHK